MTKTQDVHQLIKLVVGSSRNSLKSIQQQEWGIVIYLHRCTKACWQFTFLLSKKYLYAVQSELYFYVFKASPGVYMFLLQNINWVFWRGSYFASDIAAETVNIVCPCHYGTEMKDLVMASLKTFIGFHIYPRLVCLFSH